MSHHKIREEKDCLNCGHYVSERFCPHCGQENIINRPSAHYLIGHFVEDFVHYDSGFWKTLKTLLLKPGKIVKEYLSGKRKSYVAPVKLYIFVSFIAFFVPYILPDFSKDSDKIAIEELKKEANSHDYGLTLKNEESEKSDDDEINLILTPNSKIKDSQVSTIKELDSIYYKTPQGENISWIEYQLLKKEIKSKEIGQTEEEFKKSFKEKFTKNLPKFLFFYLPIFAFIMWLFHNKKKWLYYDHGIFTLYYFSFLLILITLNVILNWLIFIPEDLFGIKLGIADFLDFVFVAGSAAYSIIYFFRAHSVVYGEKKSVSRIKSLGIFLVNTFLFLMVLALYVGWTMYLV